MVKTVQLTSMATSKGKKRKAAKAASKTKTDDPPGTPPEKPVLKKQKNRTSTVEVSFPEEEVAKKDKQRTVVNDDDDDEEEEKEKEKEEEEEEESNTNKHHRVSLGGDEGDGRGVSKSVMNVERTQTSPAASVSSGSSMSMSSIIGHAKYWKKRHDTLAVEMKSLKEEVAILKKGGRAGRRAKKVLGAVEQQLVDEAKQAMRVVVRHVKFQKTGWLNYGRKNTQVCDMVMSRISFPPDIGDKELMKCWYKVLAPELPGVLQDLKNKMTQRYRSQYKGEIE